MYFNLRYLHAARINIINIYKLFLKYFLDFERCKETFNFTIMFIFSEIKTFDQKTQSYSYISVLKIFLSDNTVKVRTGPHCNVMTNNVI